MTTDERLSDLRLLGLDAEADDADVLEAYGRRLALYEAENLATYSLRNEDARLQLLADFEAALNRLIVKPQPQMVISKSLASEAQEIDLPAGPEPDRDGSPGAYIRYHRLAQGITPADVALETKISGARLEAIESEIPGDLAAVYVRGFMVTLARFLGVYDPEGLARAYLDKLGSNSGEGHQV